MKSFFKCLFLIFFLASCAGEAEEKINSSENSEDKRIDFTGNTQGTTFAIYCNDKIDISYDEIEGILRDFDLALSRYVPNSILSELNEASAGAFEYNDTYGYFNRCYDLSLDISRLTDGAFDPTVLPLFSVWGFDEELDDIPDSSVVESLRMLVGFQSDAIFQYNGEVLKDTNGVETSTMYKVNAKAKLDFNAIAQGLAVDVIAEELERRGAKNYFVEIGGEIRVKGLNSEGELWTIGIDQPIDGSTAEDRELHEIVQVDGRSIATSGSYRKYYEKDGIKYSHTINPKTGRPVEHTLLSATVVADNCALADGFATAFMVMGAEKSMDFIKEHPELGIELYLIFTNDKGRMDTYYTKGFSRMILD